MKRMFTLGGAAALVLALPAVALAQAAGAAAAAPPSTAEVAKKALETASENAVAINFVWTLLGGFLVMFMQAGFALLET
ncbi:MAG TPA: hypothetical protein VF832_16975, partial [Longimicrobiales bacterium]